MRRFAPQAQDKWFLALALVGVAILLWPADVECQVGLVKVWKPSAEGHTEAQVISELHTWEALSFEWVGPVGQVAGGLRDRRNVSERPCLVVVVCTGPAPLLDIAVQNAFWGMGAQFLNRLSKDLGGSKPAATTA